VRTTIGCLLLAGLLGPVPVAAQSYLIHTYTQDDGLPSSAVYGLAQDRSGKIWFATDSGVASYDGLDWKREVIPSSWPVRQFLLMESDDHGGIWAMAPGSDSLLIRFLDGQTLLLPTPHQLQSDAYHPTAFAVEGSKESPVVAVGTLRTGLWLWSQQSWLQLGLEQGLPSMTVHDVIGRDGRFTVATESGLATVVNGTVERSISLPEGQRDLRAIAFSPATRSDQLWLLALGWIGTFSNGELKVISDSIHLPRRTDYYEILPTPSGSVFFASGVTLHHYREASGQIERLGRDNGLANQGATDLLHDREGNIWISGMRGVSKIASMRFANYQQVHGLLEDEVSAICETTDGALVLGHSIGLTLLTGSEMVLIPFDSPHEVPWGTRRTLDLHRDRQGRIWLAAGELGLGQLTEGRRLVWFDAKSPLPRPVTSIVNDSDGTLLIGAGSNLIRIDGEQILPTRYSTQLPAIARRLYVSPDGTLYVATPDGLFVRSNGTLVMMDGLEDPASRDVFSVFEDSRGRSLVGTWGGLYLIEGDRLVRPGTAGLRIEEPVFFFLESSPGVLWIGTNNGVIRFSGDEQRRYTVNDGLAGRETNRDAGYIDRQGRLWIGTDAGVSMYRRELERKELSEPLLELVGIMVDASLMSLDAPLVLEPDVSSLAFLYRGVSFIDEKALRYRCRLEGFDSEWTQELPAHSRSYRYTRLPPGRYRFQVKVAGVSGIWSEAVTSPWVTIQSPVWQRWWFVTIIALAIAATIYAAAMMALRWRYAARLEDEVAARTSELRESEERYRQLFEDTAVPKLLIDPESARIIDANISACKLCRLSHRQIVGVEVDSLKLPWLDEIMRHCLTRDFPHDAHFVERGETVDVEVWANPMILQGRSLLLVIAQDVTEHRRLQEERLRASKLESVGLLAGGIAHDFNNILAAILGYISLSRTCIDKVGDVSQHLDAAEKATHRAKQLTGQLLSFSKGGAPVRKATDLAQLLRESTNLALAGSKASSHFEIASDLWPADIDDGQIAQVINNLVINASHALPHSGVVSILAENLMVDGVSVPLTDGPYVKVTVSDQGCGIAQEHLDRVFDPYFTTKEGGSGLGLATAYAVMSRHDGYIHIDSLPGVGTKVTLYLPAMPGTSLDKKDGSELVSLHQGHGRILVMDDDEELLILYEALLSQLGYGVDHTRDGEEAVTRYSEAWAGRQPYDLVIMDLTVAGGLGGKWAVRQLAKLDPKVKAVVASGYSNDPVLANYQEAGFVGALHKPFTLMQLSQLLDELLG
jgi:PAS domain S-box-containing protein